MLLASSANKNIRKEVLVEELWSGQDPCKSRSAFNTAIWRLNSILDRFPELTVVTDGDLIKLSTDPQLFIDVECLHSTLPVISRFECGENLSETQFHKFRDLAEMCSGEYLEGFNAHWVLAKRELYGSIFIRLLSCLMRHYAEQNHFEQALYFGRKILNLDPLREVTQREVMHLHVLNGERAKAVKQYKELLKILQDELGISPLQETIDLFRKISGADCQIPIFKRPDISALRPHFA